MSCSSYCSAIVFFGIFLTLLHSFKTSVICPHEPSLNLNIFCDPFITSMLLGHAVRNGFVMVYISDTLLALPKAKLFPQIRHEIPKEVPQKAESVQ